MVKFFRGNDIVLSMTDFEVLQDAGPCYISLAILVDLDGFTVRRKVIVALCKLVDFLSKLRNYVQRIKSRIDFGDDDLLVNIRIERVPEGEGVTILLNNEMCSPLDITLSVKYIAQLCQLEALYDDLFAEMELLGLNGDVCVPGHNGALL